MLLSSSSTITDISLWRIICQYRSLSPTVLCPCNKTVATAPQNLHLKCWKRKKSGHCEKRIQGNSQMSVTRSHYETTVEGLLIKSVLTDWPYAYSCLHQMQGKIHYMKLLSMRIRPRAHMVNYYSSVDAQYFAKRWYCKMSKPCVLVSNFCEVFGGLFNILLQHFICNTNFSF